MHLVSVLAGLAVAVSSAHAFFRLPCGRTVVNGRIDPIVSPGKASSHAHMIVGSNHIGRSTTFADIRASSCSTCKVKPDLSAYWIPNMYYEFKNKTYASVSHNGILVYYLQRGGSNETLHAFPDGLRILAGDPFLRSDPKTVASSAISWNCINYDSPAPETPNMANTNCPQGLRAQVFFPSCWDGKNTDSADHKSHMAYPSQMNNGFCPSTHPVHLISIFYEIVFSVDPINKLNLGGRFVLANGDPTGYGLHGDFFNGWDISVLNAAVAQCTDDSGVLEECHVFDNKYFTDAEMNACAATNPLPNEQITGSLPHLPGCVAVTNGPASATAADLVPGCTAPS